MLKKSEYYPLIESKDVMLHIWTIHSNESLKSEYEEERRGGSAESEPTAEVT